MLSAIILSVIMPSVVTLNAIILSECGYVRLSNCWNTNLDTFGGQNSNIYLNAVHFLNTNVN